MRTKSSIRRGSEQAVQLAPAKAPSCSIEVVHELLDLNLAEEDVLEAVISLTGLPTLHALQLIACERGLDIRDALGMVGDSSAADTS